MKRINGVHVCCLCSRGRSPQPPAEDEEEDFDDSLVAIDTCELGILAACQTSKALSGFSSVLALRSGMPLLLAPGIPPQAVDWWQLHRGRDLWQVTDLFFGSAFQITVICISKLPVTGSAATP